MKALYSVKGFGWDPWGESRNKISCCQRLWGVKNNCGSIHWYQLGHYGAEGGSWPEGGSWAAFAIPHFRSQELLEPSLNPVPVDERSFWNFSGYKPGYGLEPFKYRYLLWWSHSSALWALISPLGAGLQPWECPLGCWECLLGCCSLPGCLCPCSHFGSNFWSLVRWAVWDSWRWQNNYCSLLGKTSLEWSCICQQVLVGTPAQRLMADTAFSCSLGSLYSALP